MRKRTIIFLSVLVVALIVAAYVYYEYNKPHRSLGHVDFSLGANELLSEFEMDESVANGKFLDKVIEVKGVVKEIIGSDTARTILLGDAEAMSSVSCALTAATSGQVNEVHQGDSATIRGFCTGMLLDVQLVECEVVK